MSPTSNLLIQANSNDKDVGNLKDKDSAVWKSNPADVNVDSPNPSLQVKLPEDARVVATVTVTGTENVNSVIITVIDDDGKKV